MISPFGARVGYAWAPSVGEKDVLIISNRSPVVVDDASGLIVSVGVVVDKPVWLKLRVCVCLSPFGLVGCGRPLLMRGYQINVINNITVVEGPPPLFWLKDRLGLALIRGLWAVGRPLRVRDILVGYHRIAISFIVSCYSMLRYVTLCYSMLLYVTLCYSM